MRYTHYLPATGERGTVIPIPYGALRNKDQFEKAVGRLVSEFNNTEDFLSETTDVTLMDGTQFYFFDTHKPSSVFKKEDGTLVQGSPNLPGCAKDPNKTTRVDIKVIEGTNVLTPFTEDHASSAIISDIAAGLGATFFDRRDQLTVIPCHNIEKAHIVKAPYGG